LQFNLDLVIYLLGLAATAGTLLARISALEKKVDKHNNVIERLYKVEERERTDKERIDHLEKIVEEKME